MADRIGQQLGHYRLTHLLGQGSLAEVYLGEHMLLGTTIAIKVLRTQVMPEDREQFQQEVRILASLKHPHILRILDFGIEECTPYLLMDYIPNGTLRTRHPKGTMLPVVTVVEYIKQVAQSLQYAHELKIVHSDVKQENMLIGEQNRVLLSDFGIALIAQGLRYQSTKDRQGTIAYMAPEQIAGHECPASDQYALGIVAYEWLCGTCPFHRSFTEIAIQHSVIPPTSLRDRFSTPPSDIEQVILIALAKRPEDRFASMHAFANAFEQASQDYIPTVRAHPTPRSFPLPSPPSDTPVPLIITEMTPGLLSHQPTGLSDMVTTQANQSVSLPVPTNEAPSDLQVPEKATGMGRVSRRAVLIGAGIVTTAAVGAGMFVVLRSLPPAPPAGLLFTYRGHSLGVLSVGWSPDGQRIASGSWDKTVQVWNARDGSNVFNYTGHPSKVYTVAWSPDGKRVASGSTDAVQVWNTSGGSHVFTYRGHSDIVWDVEWSPDGQRIASCSDDGTVQMWNPSDGSDVFIYKGHPKAVYAVGWSPDGQHIASGSADNTVQVWNASDGSRVFTYTGRSVEEWSVAWSPDGKRIASGSADNAVQVWNANDGGNVFTYTGHSQGVSSVGWSPDGKHIASGSYDNTVQVWNARDGSNVFTYTGHTGRVYKVGWSSDGKRIASGSRDKTVQVWHVV